MDKRLLEILCCPVSHVPVRPINRQQLSHLNQQITEGSITTVAGEPVSTVLDSALITQDDKLVYRVEDGIPVMLADEAIPVVQMAHFPEH